MQDVLVGFRIIEAEGNWLFVGTKSLARPRTMDGVRNAVECMHATYIRLETDKGSGDASQAFVAPHAFVGLGAEEAVERLLTQAALEYATQRAQTTGRDRKPSVLRCCQ